MTEDELSDRYTNRLANPELRCRNKCGFYGNPIYLGYCSKCYKELVRDAQTAGARGEDDEADQSTAAEAIGVHKLASKKKTKGRGRLFKSPLKTEKVAASASSVSTASIGQASALIPEPKKSKKSIDPFNEFMKTLKRPAAQDLVQHLKICKKHINDRSVATIEEMSESVQEFYRSTAERLTTHPLFSTMNEEQQEETMDGIEKHLMTSIYNKVFCPSSSEDQSKDLLLQRRIRLLHWLTPSHLDVSLNMEKPVVQEIFRRARQELWNMESRKAPQDKLICISKSCKFLLDALHQSEGKPASADEFVPSLIYLLIHTSPEHLHSNINYIDRFSNPSRLLSGELGYYFTNLCGAVVFIENISPHQLKISPEEFDRKMGYINGKTEIDLLLEEDDVQEEYEKIAVMQSCSQAIDDLFCRLQVMMDEATDLENKMDEFQLGLKDQVESILSHPPPRSLYSKKPSPLQSRTNQMALFPGQQVVPKEIEEDEEEPLIQL